MGFEVGIVLICITLDARGLLHHGEDALHVAVEHIHRQGAALHRLKELVDLIRSSRHEQVVAGLHLLHRIVCSEPVGHDHAFVAPVVAQHLSEKPVIFRGIGAVNLVVGTHYRPGLALLHGNLETAQIELAKGPLGDDFVYAVTIEFLVVCGVMLHGGSYSL